MRPRFHARFPGAACEGLDGLGPGARLAAYRIEPVRSVDGPQHYLDLTFVEGERVAVVGAIRIDRHALAHRDASPFVAPREALAVLDPLERACDALEPELAAIFAAAVEPGENLYRVHAVAEPTLAARRAVRALGVDPAQEGGGRVVEPAHDGRSPSMGTPFAPRSAGRTARTFAQLMAP